MKTGTRMTIWMAGRIVSALNLLLLLGTAPAPAAPGDGVADRVFGKPDLSSTGGCTTLAADCLNFPIGLAIDDAGNLFVADFSDSRVLVFLDASKAAVWPTREDWRWRPMVNCSLPRHCKPNVLAFEAPMTTDRLADVSVPAVSLPSPFGIALDDAGNLYVADGVRNRVLQYDQPLTTDVLPDRVFGQPQRQQPVRAGRCGRGQRGASLCRRRQSSGSGRRRSTLDGCRGR